MAPLTPRIAPRQDDETTTPSVGQERPLRTGNTGGNLPPVDPTQEPEVPTISPKPSKAGDARESSRQRPSKDAGRQKGLQKFHALGSSYRHHVDDYQTEREARIRKALERHDTYLKNGFIPLKAAYESMKRFKPREFRDEDEDDKESADRNKVSRKVQVEAGQPAKKGVGQEDDEGNHVVDTGPFVSGDIVEVLDPSFKWQIGVVTSSRSKVNDTEGERQGPVHVNVLTADTYRTQCLNYGLYPDEIRHPRQALMAIFGDTPFWFQQYALLQAEQRMSFNAHDLDDFQEIEWESWAREKFDVWLEKKDIKGKSNVAFKEYYDEQPEGVQEALKVKVHDDVVVGDALNALSRINTGMGPGTFPLD